MKQDNAKVLWHYTSIDTLVKICTNLTMHATHYAFMNDAEEVKMGANSILNAIEDMSKSKEDKDTFNYIRTRFNDLLGDPILNLFYIISFSKARDALSQWRGYTPTCGGCAIGFDASKLEQALSKKIDSKYGIRHAPMAFVDCVYPKTQRAIQLTAAPFLVRIKDFYKSRNENNQNEIELKISQEFWKLMSWTYCVKNPCFEEEQEKRLVFSHLAPYSTIQFENRKPFLEISIDKKIFPDLIKEVIISPHGNVEKNIQFVRFFSHALNEKYNYKVPKGLLFPVTKSKLPYR
ncbi:MAG: DUF2971 domain-containing protein [Lentisphaerae bacterium]|nr:DUF2971 domain-containing protein [Lentisphaerota bacterium]